MTEEKPTVLQRLNSFRKAITVEPSTLFFLSASLLSQNTSQTLALEKACRVNLNLSDVICDSLRNQDTGAEAVNELMVQEYVAKFVAYKSIITSVLPCLILIFAGGWMDVTGRRKIMMIMPLVGETLVQISNILNTIFFQQLRVEYQIFGEALLGAMFGGWTIYFMAVFSFIVDITTTENRTYRLGLVSFTVYIGMPIGISLSGVMLKSFGYLTVYITALTAAVLNLCYLIFVLSDPVRSKEQKEHDNRGFFFFIKTFFSPAHLLNSLRVVFRKTQDSRTLQLFILFGATCFLMGPMNGEMAIMYMSTRYRFGWDELQYSIFQSYNMVLTIIGTMFAVLVISKTLKWHDSVMGILSTSSKILASFVYCFATTGAIFYLGPFVDFLNGTAFIAMRSIFSKTVEPHEIAKLNSIVAIVEVLMPLGYVPLYTTVYTATMSVMPGLVFLMGGALTIPPLLVFIWLLYKHRRNIRVKKLSRSESMQSL